jgi:hypothetical protein
MNVLPTQSSCGYKILINVCSNVGFFCSEYVFILKIIIAFKWKDDLGTGKDRLSIKCYQGQIKTHPSIAL